MLKVIIVDDEPLILNIMEAYLKKIAVCYKFSNAIDAADKVKELSPDLIISDFYMPEMSGLEFVTKIREFSQVPVVLMSGSHVDDDLKKTFTYFLKKPVNIKEIQELVLKLTNKNGN